ncbi:hypothetical protein [Campylobacter sp. 7477a]|uniref:hypothetical protein n=1 Tax=Campylobacter sp. 7477a TaxID=2735741 RepID=UPI003014B290|nr:hypothetical protein [Campylobacter sp. 7477a]
MPEKYDDRLDKVENKLDGISDCLQNIKIETAKLEQSLEYIKKDIEGSKTEIWDIKKYQTNISQHDKDLAVLMEKIKNTEVLILSYKNEMETKMVTKKELDEKKYKSWGLWISIIALIASIVVPFVFNK